jgi:hypothetical protein
MMASTICVIAILALIAWRFVFSGLQRRQPVQGIGIRGQRQVSLFREISVAVRAEDLFANGSQGADPVLDGDGAATYLQRIVALTRATQSGDTFVLDVGTTRFIVRERCVRRLRDVLDTTCRYEETCFQFPHKSMPVEQQIATVLLELKSNPALFGRWAAQIGAVKPDGQLFSGTR